MSYVYQLVIGRSLAWKNCSLNQFLPKQQVFLKSADSMVSLSGPVSKQYKYMVSDMKI